MKQDNRVAKKLRERQRAENKNVLKCGLAGGGGRGEWDTCKAWVAQLVDDVISCTILSLLPVVARPIRWGPGLYNKRGF
jgi:hypothetical protein